MFIVFEGLDGSGKSTLMNYFLKEVKKRKLDFITTVEPGGTKVGARVREVLLDKALSPSSEAELLLYQASRAELVEKVIKPALELSKWVVSDRFYQSTLAFQGFARGLSVEDICWLNDYVTRGVKPDVVIWVNTPVKVCEQRLQARESQGGELSRLDQEKRNFHEKVYEGYKFQSESDSHSQWVILDGTLTPEELFKSLLLKMESLWSL